MNCFSKVVRTSASTPTGGAEHFPYGFSVSVKTLLTMLRDRLELDHVAEMGDEAVIFATEPDNDSDEDENPDGIVNWMFIIPAEFVSERLIEACGWFKPLVRG